MSKNLTLENYHEHAESFSYRNNYFNAIIIVSNGKKWSNHMRLNGGTFVEWNNTILNNNE